MCIPKEVDVLPNIMVKENGETVPGILPKHYICKSCKRSLVSGKMPKLSSTNNLQVDYIPHGMTLSELEANLIAKNLIFQKIHKLPKSRWQGTHDRMINIPIYDEDILCTVDKLPRTPTEASIISVKLKRKMGYKGHHTEQVIDSRKVFKFLNFLKESGHPSYDSFEKIEDFERRCEEEDPEGFLLIHPDYEFLEDPPEELSEVVDEVLTGEEDGMLPDKTEEAKLEAEEEEYLTHDAVRKFQIDHDKSSVLTQRFPEIGTDSMLCFAPGEGKVPTNILNNKSWDIDSFPHLFPSGDHGMFSKRDVSLKDQEFLTQRLCNKDTRFEQCPPFVFAAAAYLEEKQMSRNIGLTFSKGKVASRDGNIRSYQLDDCYGVLDNCKNTPRYHQKNKYNMLAALDNFGPFHIFFTLSCADLRWTENFSSILREKGWTVVWDFGANSKDSAVDAEVEVLLPDGSLKKLDLFLKEDADESLHESIRTNVFTATRTFMKRVTSFKTHILMGVNSPINIKRFSWKTEYQGRGAGHVHGVAWCDLPKISKVFDEVPMSSSSTKQTEKMDSFQASDAPIEDVAFYHTPEVAASSPTNQTEKMDSFQASDAPMEDVAFYHTPEVAESSPTKQTEKMDSFQASDAPIEDVAFYHTPEVAESSPSDKQTKKVDSFQSSDASAEDVVFYQTCDNTDIQSEINEEETVLEKAFRALRENVDLTPEQEEVLLTLVDQFTTCSLNPWQAMVQIEDNADISEGEKIVKTVRDCQTHHHTKTCRKSEKDCRFNIPRMPMWKSLLTYKVKGETQEEKEKKDQVNKKVLKQV
jgi:hypothetical protein